MTVAEILDQIRGEYGGRHQITEDQALLVLNEIQKMAMDADLEAFLSIDTFLTVDAAEGPYSFPAVPPCRKFVGLTKLTKAQLLGYTEFGTPADENPYSIYANPSNRIDRRKEFLPIEVNQLDRSFTFLEDPTTEADTYRQVYYRGPQEIRSTLDDGRLIIPETYHYSLCVQASIKLSDFFIYGEPVTRPVLDNFFKPWWDSLEGSTDPNNTDYISEGQLGP